MSRRGSVGASQALQTIGAVIVGVVGVLGLAALGVPTLRLPFFGLACALIAFAYGLVVNFFILAIWHVRALLPKKGWSPIYLAFRRHTSSLRGWRLAVSVGILLLGMLFVVFSVLFRPETDLPGNAWGGYGIAVWGGGLGILWCAACIPHREPSPV
jgi:hypothetical protein